MFSSDDSVIASEKVVNGCKKSYTKIKFLNKIALTNCVKLNIIEYKEIAIMPKTITLRVEDNIYNTLKRAAEGDRRTISNFMEYAALNYVINNNIVDDDELKEVMVFEKDIKRGLEDVKKGRYKIIE